MSPLKTESDSLDLAYFGMCVSSHTIVKLHKTLELSKAACLIDFN